ncbi:MAG: TolC family protein [bacterium]|nr:MAG: TolC family protein [bacterium]
MSYKRCISFFVFIFGLTLLSLARAGAELPVVRIGIIVDGTWERDEALRALFEGEILALTQGEFDVRFPPEKRINAEWRMESTKEALDRLLADPEVDLILANGTFVSYEASRRKYFRKPVIAPFVVDAEIQGILTDEGTSGIKNLNYVSFPSPTKTDILTFHSIVPFRKFAMFMNQPYHEMMPDLMNRLTSRFREEGLDPVIIPVGESIDEAFAKLPADVEAVYVTPLIQLSKEEFDKLVNGLIERKLPSYSFLGRDEVVMGIMAGSQIDFFPKIARRVALNVQRILLGEDAGSIPAPLSPNTQLTINMATAREIDIYPRWDILTEAELVSEEREEIERRLDIYTVVQEAIAVNLDLAAKERFVAAGEQNVKEAWAPFLPRIDLSGTGVIIDGDRAEASFGQVAERTLSGSVTATQIIFSEPALANLSIQRNVQRTREQELRQLRFDIIQAAVTAYLNVLKTKTFEKIQKENLKRTRSNLEMAQVRDVVGSAGPAEVYRWESQIATNRKTVIEANSRRNRAEIEMNRLLHRPAEEFFQTEEFDIADLALLSDREKVVTFLRDPRSFRLFRDFMVKESLVNSPELAGFDAAIAAQKRAFGSATNSFWSPTIALQGSISHIFLEDGKGSEGGFDIPLDQSTTFSLPEADNTDWSVALSLSYPLFSGGEKLSKRARAHEELLQLTLERKALLERIEQRVRSTLHKVGASYAGIDQAYLAAEAADKSLKVVEDAYSKGVVSILDLLDAQNAALVADLSAANAVYDFLIDLIAFQRAAGNFDMLMTKKEREAFLNRAREYYKKLGVDLDL